MWGRTARVSDYLKHKVLDRAHIFKRKSSMEGTEVKDLIANIAKMLVDKPEEVRVTEIKGNQTSVIELSVAKEDLGQIIGKHGRIARSLRTILGAASTGSRKRFILEILE